MAANNPAKPHDESCIFCRIVAGSIPCHRIYEDDMVLSFLDIGPVTPGHTLVIPKAHYGTVMAAPPELMAELARRLPRLARAVTQAVHCPACHVLLNSGAEAMQSVAHLHYHIIPRRLDDSFHVPWPAGTLDKAVAQSLTARISENLKQV